MKKIHLIFIAIGLIAVTSYSSALYARGSTVTLCTNKKSGALRYIKSGNCKSSENKLEIDQNGEVGQTGPQGPQGPQGPAGPAGSDGANGANGANGDAVIANRPGANKRSQRGISYIVFQSYPPLP